MKSLATLQVEDPTTHENAVKVVVLTVHVAVQFIVEVKGYATKVTIGVVPLRRFRAPFVVQVFKTIREYSDLAFAWFLAESALAMYPVIEGTKISANIAKIAITTINSIRVKPFVLRFFVILYFFLVGLFNYS